MSATLRLTPGARRTHGLITFRLALWRDGKELETWAVNSGAPGAQVLRIYDDPKSRPGSNEPIPEDVYELGPLEWAGSGYDDWWSDALGPVWVSIYAPGDSQAGKRGQFGFHLDANRAVAPGSAGCVVITTLDDLKRFVAAFEQHKPDTLVVDHGLGTVPGAPKDSEQSDHPTGTLWINKNGAVLDVYKDLPAGQYQIYTVGGADVKLVRR